MDLSKLPDSQRQELEQLQKQFQEHQAQQQQQQQQQPAYDPFQVHQPYNPSHAYDQSYYYNYHDSSQHHQQQSHQQYDASYYHNYYPNSNSYQQQQYTHSETMPAATAYAAPNEQQRNLGLGQVQDPYVNSGNQGNLGYNPTAAAAVAALSHLTQFAGSMAGVEHHNQGHFRPPVGHTPYRGGGRRGGGPFRGGGHGNSGFRQPNTGSSGPPFHGRGRGRGRGIGGQAAWPTSWFRLLNLYHQHRPMHNHVPELLGVKCVGLTAPMWKCLTSTTMGDAIKKTSDCCNKRRVLTHLLTNPLTNPLAKQKKTRGSRDCAKRLRPMGP